MTPLPDESNVFGTLHTQLSAEEVAEEFRRQGWTVRKCSWTDYEVRKPFAELVIESHDPVLIHGPVADPLTNVEHIVVPLAARGIAGSLEIYDDSRTLILKRTLAGLCPSCGYDLRATPGRCSECGWREGGGDAR